MSALSFLGGVAIGGRFIYLEIADSAGDHSALLILTALFLVLGVFLSILGLLAEHIATTGNFWKSLSGGKRWSVKACSISQWV